VTPAGAIVAASDGELTREQMIPLLQRIQAAEGYLSAEAMILVAEALGTPVSRVYGVATFYNQFRLAPLGEHVIEVCRGTACHVKQSLLLAQQLKRRLKLRDDGNSADGRYTVVSVACLGACSIAPVVKLDGEFHGHLTTEKLEVLLDRVDARDEGTTVARDEGTAVVRAEETAARDETTAGEATAGESVQGEAAEGEAAA
jgi:NADH-quinone oxidoreductase subunit E